MSAPSKWLAGLLAASALWLGGCKSTPIALGPRLDGFLQASFTGTGALDEAALKDVVLAELSSGGKPERATKAQVDDAAYALELHYRDQGYPDASVQYEFDGEPRPPRASFKIKPGPYVELTKVTIEGYEKLELSELEGFFGPVAAGQPFVRSRLAPVADRIVKHYLALGFLAVAVEKPEVERVEPAGAEVRFTLAEGPKFVVRSAAIEGAIESAEAKLSELAASFVGRPYGPHLAFELRAAVLREHGEAGYPDCAIEVQVEEDPDSGDVSLRLVTTPGPLVTLSGIEVAGNEGVPSKRVRARLALEPGDVYDSRMVNRSFNQLYATGLFETVRFDLEGEGSERTLAVNVTESPSLQLFAEPGWGSYEGPRIRAGIDENNLFSTGRRGRIEGWFSARAEGVELQLADPFLFGSPVTGQLSLFASGRQEPSFTVDRTGAALDFRRAWNEQFSTTAGVEFGTTRLSDVDVSAVGTGIPQALLDSIDVGELTFAMVYDTRDNVLMPGRGGLARFHSNLSLDQLGSGIEAFESGVDLVGILPVSERTLLAVAGRVTVIAPFGSTDVIPLQERLFNGGENTVRSFRESQLGPEDSAGEPLGGEARTLMSLELRRRLTGNVSGALFYDLGNVVLDYEDYLSFPDFRHGLGFGVRYLLPIGPLRLDAAWNPDASSNEADFVIHFAVGLPF